MLTSVSVVPTTSRRLCVARLVIDKCHFLLINVYLPHEGLDDTELHYAEELAVIEDVIGSNKDCHIVLGGDFNVDFARQSANTMMLKSFCDENGLTSSISNSNNSVDYTYNFNMQRFSILDHFFLSGVLFQNSLVQTNVCHDLENLSDHDPILLKLSVDVKMLGSYKRVHTPTLSWVKANDLALENYRTMLSRSLSNIDLPTDILSCREANCQDSNHLSGIEQFCHVLTECSVSAAVQTIPKTNVGCNGESRGRIPGWNELVKPSHDRALLWHKIWVECDRPRHGEVAECMRKTRAAYHYAIRCAKKDRDSIVRQRIANALLCDNDRSFWTEIRRIRKLSSTVTSTIDGINNVNEIASLFSQKYKELYCSVPYDVEELDRLKIEINESLAVDTQSCVSDCVFTHDEVHTAVSKLRAHKRQGCGDLSSDHLIHAGGDFLQLVAHLFTMIVTHGTFVGDFLYSTIIPIPKNSATSNSANFRGIALSSIFGKVFDKIILLRYQSQLATSEHQFGFKPGCSTSHCTVILKETLYYYTHNNNPVYSVFLDVSKAFDKIRYCKLFRLLLDRNVPGVIVRALIHLYTNNFIRVNWFGVSSPYFMALNGVKQGAVLSPILFCIYLDNLLISLSNSGFGCFIGHNFVGALAYADDIVLLAPTATALRKLIAICESYAKEYSITFNPDKTKCLIVHPVGCHRYVDYNFFLYDKPIANVTSFTHLGHVISGNLLLNDKDDVSLRCSDFVRQANNVLCYFKTVSPHVKFFLFQSFCNSFYGCEIWTLTDSKLTEISVKWRKALRRVWDIPQTTHCNLLPLISECLNIFDEICRRSYNFVVNCYNSKYSLIRSIAAHSLCNIGFSVIGNNYVFFRKRFCIEKSFRVSKRSLYSACLSSYSDETLARADLLRELLLVRDGSLTLPAPFQTADIMFLIEHLCTV